MPSQMMRCTTSTVIEDSLIILYLEQYKSQHVIRNVKDDKKVNSRVTQITICWNRENKVSKFLKIDESVIFKFKNQSSISKSSIETRNLVKRAYKGSKKYIVRNYYLYFCIVLHKWCHCFSKWLHIIGFSTVWNFIYSLFQNLNTAASTISAHKLFRLLINSNSISCHYSK